MSRIANRPVIVPNGVTLTVQGNQVDVKGPKGQLCFQIHQSVKGTLNDKEFSFEFDRDSQESRMHAGSARANVANMVTGVSHGFEKKVRRMLGLIYIRKKRHSWRRKRIL